MLKNLYLLLQLGCLLEVTRLQAGNMTLPSIKTTLSEEEQLLCQQIIQTQATRLYKRLENLPTYDAAVPLYQIARTLAEKQYSQPHTIDSVVKSIEQCTPHYLFWKNNVESKYLFIARGQILAALLPEKAREFLQEKFPSYFFEEEAKKAADALDAQRNNINKNLEENISKPTESPQTLLTKFPILTSPKHYPLWVR